jgi:hypothetical protein
MKLKIFIEFFILPDRRDEFLSLIPKIRDYQQIQWGVKDYEIYEGTDQPNLFVEEFYIEGEDDYLKIKEERVLEKELLWSDMNACVKGGGQKVHIWAFKNVINN